MHIEYDQVKKWRKDVSSTISSSDDVFTKWCVRLHITIESDMDDIRRESIYHFSILRSTLEIWIDWWNREESEYQKIVGKLQYSW